MESKDHPTDTACRELFEETALMISQRDVLRMTRIPIPDKIQYRNKTWNGTLSMGRLSSMLPLKDNATDSVRYPASYPMEDIVTATAQRSRTESTDGSYDPHLNGQLRLVELHAQ